MSLLVAAALDAARAEPPLRLHPVVWAGRYLAAAERHVPAGPPGRALLAGGVAWAGGAAAALVAGLAAEAIARRLPPLVRPLARGVALWPLLSVRLLHSEVAGVEAALAISSGAGREALARIVSRDTAGLGPAEVRAAALQSLSENLSDSVVAPVAWFAVAGLPGAAVYRFTNTADACWGYRSARWEHAGRVAARVDDLANLVPARLTALLLLPRPSRWPALRREAGRTPSPNSGWPMAALALAHDLRLAKRDAWVLHPTGATPGPDDVSAGLRTTRRTAWLAVLLGAVATRALPTHRPARPTRSRPHPGGTR